MDYCYNLAFSGAQLIANYLGTEIMDNEEGSLTRECYLVNVRLPLEAVDDAAEGDAHSRATAPSSILVPYEDAPLVTQYMARACITEHATFIAIFFYGTCWWARLSAQIYLDMRDFEHAGIVLRKLCTQVSELAYREIHM